MKTANVLVGLVVALGFTGFVNAEVVFSCDTPDGKQTVLEYNKDNNRFIMSRGNNAITPEVTVMKSPDDMGTSYNASREENFTQREVYVPDGEPTYVLGYAEQGNKKSGFVQIMEGGTQVSYHECKPVTFHASFNNYELFDGMTYVD